MKTRILYYPLLATILCGGVTNAFGEELNGEVLGEVLAKNAHMVPDMTPTDFKIDWVAEYAKHPDDGFAKRMIMTCKAAVKTSEPCEACYKFTKQVVDDYNAEISAQNAKAEDPQTATVAFKDICAAAEGQYSSGKRSWNYFDYDGEYCQLPATNLECIAVFKDVTDTTVKGITDDSGTVYCFIGKDLDNIDKVFKTGPVAVLSSDCEKAGAVYQDGICACGGDAEYQNGKCVCKNGVYDTIGKQCMYKLTSEQSEPQMEVPVHTTTPPDFIAGLTKTIDNKTDANKARANDRYSEEQKLFDAFKVNAQTIGATEVGSGSTLFEFECMPGTQKCWFSLWSVSKNQGGFYCCKTQDDVIKISKQPNDTKKLCKTIVFPAESREAFKKEHNGNTVCADNVPGF